MNQIFQSITNCYKSIITRSWLKIGMLFSAILLGGAAMHAQAIDKYDIKVANAPAGANDIHIVLQITNIGPLSNIVPINPAVQTITNNGNGWDASWSTAFLGGETYETNVNAPLGITFVSGFWTKNGANIGPIAPGDVTITPLAVVSVPTLPTWALASLILIVAAAGFFYLRQKKHKMVG
jgi:hypothetical protein